MSNRETSRVYQMKLEEIHIEEGFNVRLSTQTSQAKLRDLAMSIAQVGVKEPLLGYETVDGIFYLEDGHRRLAAVAIANAEFGASIESIPVRYEAKFANETDRTENLLIRNSGEPLTLLEQADVVKRLLNYGRTEEAISSHAGYSISHVKNLILLCSASEGVRSLVIEDFVSASNAIEAIRKFGDKAQEALTEAVAMVNDGGGKKKRVTQKSLNIKKKVDWKRIGPKLVDMLQLIVFSVDSEEVRTANYEDAKTLLAEIDSLQN